MSEKMIAPEAAPGMYTYGIPKRRGGLLHLVIGPGFRKDTLCGKRVDDTRQFSNGRERLCGKCAAAAEREPRP